MYMDWLVRDNLDVLAAFTDKYGEDEGTEKFNEYLENLAREYNEEREHEDLYRTF